ncbi:MAG TPA: hypothetical protein VFN07_08890 [Trueperaceae bacterium]|nr:hypothetical protein [Trueperaceae bacterium]
MSRARNENGAPTGARRPGTRAGWVLVAVGAAALLMRFGVGGVLIEVVWLAAILTAAAWTWRLIERRRRPGAEDGGRWSRRLPVLIVAGFGLFAMLTLNQLAGVAALASIALFSWLLFASASTARRRATGFAVVGGLFSTLAAVAAVGQLLPSWDSGVIFFLGMTATFTLVYLLPREQGGARWALWPALAWAALTLLVNDPSGGLGRWMLPLALIGAGVALIGYRRGKR